MSGENSTTTKAAQVAADRAAGLNTGSGAAPTDDTPVIDAGAAGKGLGALGDAIKRKKAAASASKESQMKALQSMAPSPAPSPKS